jgi:hypothetical protein
MPKDVMTGEDIFNAGFASAFEEAKAMPVFDKLAANLGLNTEAAPVAMPVFDKLAANLGLTEEAPAAAPETGMTLFEELLAKEAGKMDAIRAAAGKAGGVAKRIGSLLSGSKLKALRGEHETDTVTRQGGEAARKAEEIREKRKVLGARLGAGAAVTAGGALAAKKVFGRGKDKDKK